MIRKTARDCKKQPKQRRPLKLYVWAETPPFDFYNGAAYVLAHSETETRKLIAQKYSAYKVETLKDTKPRVVTKPEAFIYQEGE